MSKNLPQSASCIPLIACNCHDLLLAINSRGKQTLQNAFKEIKKRYYTTFADICKLCVLTRQTVLGDALMHRQHWSLLRKSLRNLDECCAPRCRSASHSPRPC